MYVKALIGLALVGVAGLGAFAYVKVNNISLPWFSEQQVEHATSTAVTVEPKITFEDIVVGQGAAFSMNELDLMVRLSYVGKYKSGEVFDEVLTEGGQLFFASTTLPSAVREHISDMKVGGIRVITVPHQLTYGNTGSKVVPLNVDVTYEVTLFGIAVIESDLQP